MSDPYLDHNRGDLPRHEAEPRDDHARYTYDATCPKCRDRDTQPDRPEPVDEGIRVGRVRPDTWAVEQATCVKCAWHSQNRPEPVDPSEVRVGDVVEIEGDDWMVRGEVSDVTENHVQPVRVKLTSNQNEGFAHVWPFAYEATVRVLHRAEPEPDPAAVEALIEAMEEADRSLGEREKEDWPALARTLIRDHGVQVVSRDE